MEKLANLSPEELLQRYVSAEVALRTADTEEEIREAVELRNDLFFELMRRMEK